MADWTGDTGWTAGADGAPTPPSGGFVELCGQDFTTMTPTTMGTIATHTVDGEDIVVGNLGGGVWDITANGLSVTGGTAFANVTIDFAQFGITATDYEMLALVLDVDDAGFTWAALLLETPTNWVGVSRYAVDRLRAMIDNNGTYNDDNGIPIVLGSDGHAVIWCAGASVIRDQVASPTGGPLSIANRGPSAHSGNERWTYNPDKIWLELNGLNSRSVQFRSWKLYGVPTT